MAPPGQKRTTHEKLSHSLLNPMRFSLLVSVVAVAVSACQGIPTTGLTVAAGQKTI